jgi:Cof subfamily protein (haloacid dehalogenase superfamily)
MPKSQISPESPTQLASTASTGPIRLIALDLDGTTVGSSNQIQPQVAQAIAAARARGVQVAIATGRMFRSALRFHQDLDLTLPLMAYQGALIKAPATDKVYRHWTLPQAHTLALLDYFQQVDFAEHLSIHLYVNDQLYVREILPETIVYAERSGIEPTAVGDLHQFVLSSPEPTKLLALSEQPPLIDQLLLELRQQYSPAELYFTKSVATFFEATHPQVNKGTAVRYLAEDLLGLTADQVMAIGDNFNDVEMIQYAGIGIAMANAPEAVRAAANWVAPDVEADGVAAAIEQFILSSSP